MLQRIGNSHLVSECKVSIYDRDEKDDIKKAIEYLYEFQEKLSNLHPIAMEVIEKILQRQY